MAEPLTIRQLLERVRDGVIRIPKFQRSFVWEPDDIAFLMDSIYRGYPVGSILLWQTRERLEKERDLGPFELPEPKKDWPIQYVLDGQQRITSIFGVFQTYLQPKANTDAFRTYFDMAKADVFEEQFVNLPATVAPAPNLFPLNTLFDPVPFQRACKDLKPETLERAADLQRRFQETFIPCDLIEFEDREQIAMIFERVNRAGKRLDTFQLLSAWTWSTEFDLQESIAALAEELKPVGFGAIEQEQDLLMKCCAAVISGQATVSAIVELHGPTVRAEFEKIRRAILGAIDFLGKELNIVSLEIMPYPAMLVPLARFFATDKVSGVAPSSAQRATLLRWFWRSCFSRRYSSGVGRAHAMDIGAMDRLRDHDVGSLGDFPASVDQSFFISNTFNLSTVNTKTFVLMLASRHPRSLLSGAPVDLSAVLQRCNRNEFHHIFPKALLTRAGLPPHEINMLANFCFLSNADNQKIKDQSPKDYVSLIPNGNRDNILWSNCLNGAHFDGFLYKYFYDERSDSLVEIADSLMA